MTASYHALLIVSALLITACDSGGSPPPPPASPDDYSVSIDSTGLSLAGYDPQPFEPENRMLEQVVNVEYQGDGLLVAVGDDINGNSANWLQITPLSESPTSASYLITLRILDYGDAPPLPLQMSATVHFVTGSEDGEVVKIAELPVSIEIVGRPKLSRNKIAIADIAGNTAKTQSLSLDAPGMAWEMADVPAWLQVTPASGVGSAEINFECDTVPVTAPSQETQTITLKDLSTHVDIPVEVVCGKDSHRLLASRRAVALSEFSNVSRLSRSVKVTHNGETPINWTASTSAAWLSVTAGGATGSELVITANPAALATNGTYNGTVTLASADVAAADADTIRVSFFKTSAPLPEGITAPGHYVRGVPDILRNLVYTQESFMSPVHARHIFDGSDVQIFSKPGFCITPEDVSDDGKWMYLWTRDCSTEAAIHQSNLPYSVYRVNLDTHAAELVFAIPANSFASRPEPLRYIRQNGVALLVLVGDGKIISAQNGAIRGSLRPNSLTNPELTYPEFASYASGMGDSGAVNADGSLIVRTGKPNDYVHFYSISDVTALDSVPVRITATHVARTASYNAEIMGLNPGSDRVYADNGVYGKTGNIWSLINARTLLSPDWIEGGVVPPIFHMPNNNVFSPAGSKTSQVLGRYDRDLNLSEDYQDFSTHFARACQKTPDELAIICGLYVDEHVSSSGLIENDFFIHLPP